MQRNEKRPSGRSRVQMTQRRVARPRVPAAAQAGLSLVEVLVSISLLGLLAIGFAPVLYNGLSITSGQTTVAYAAQQASSYIDDARAGASASCSGLVSAIDEPSISTDQLDVLVKVSGTVPQCSTPLSGPKAVTLTVTACTPAAGSDDADACSTDDKTLTVVTTKILVQG